MKPTIKDVAKLAGVSVGTASKVMNNEGHVKPELQEKVRSVVRQLNYRPNAVARSLKSSNTHTIAVLLADITNPFQMTLAKGIEDVTYEHDYQLVISSTKENPDIERRNLKMLYEKRVEGMIICTTGKVNDEILALIDHHIPVVLVDRPVLSLPVDIVADHNMLGMALLAGHLHKLGHSRVGVVHGDLNTVHGLVRYEGVVKAFEQYAMELPPELLFDGNFTHDGGVRAMDHFLTLSEPPTAVLSANNNMAAGILQACRERSIRIPQDISVVTFGELEYNWNLIRPSVTHVSQSPLMIGRKAAELVLGRLNNDNKAEVSHVFFTPELIVGESSGSFNRLAP
jgi:LacI family transcriptional regulator